MIVDWPLCADSTSQLVIVASHKQGRSWHTVWSHHFLWGQIYYYLCHQSYCSTQASGFSSTNRCFSLQKSLQKILIQNRTHFYFSKSGRILLLFSLLHLRHHQRGGSLSFCSSRRGRRRIRPVKAFLNKPNFYNDKQVNSTFPTFN